MKKTNLKNNLFKLFIAALALIVTLSLAPLSGQARQARADETSYSEFIETVEVSQSQFEIGDLTSMPSLPSSWTGDYINGAAGNVVSGVLTLKSAYIANHEKTKLGIYPEYKDKNSVPATPFGKTSTNPQGGNYYENTNKNVLMINTNKSITSYGFSSEDISLAANSFYSFSAWVKTGNFTADEGAAITITGLKEAVGIWNIDTVSNLAVDSKGLPDLNESNNWGWKKYTIYVGTGSASETVKIQLSVGDNIEDHSYASQGYAFFDNISVSKYSPTYYYDLISATLTNSTVYDMYSYEYAYGNVGGAQKEIGNFTNGTDGWSTIYDEETGSEGRIDFNAYNAGAPFVDNKAFGFNNDPFSPKGKSETFNNIMVLSSYQKSKDAFNKVKAGIKSPDITIEKESNYELTVWYNTQQMDGSAAIVISGEGTRLSKQYKITPVEVGDLTTDSNAQRYGWQKAEIYIKGSILKDVAINVELWMGYGSATSGIAMFDDITLRKISSKEYNELSVSSTVVVIDSGSLPSPNVSNGFFDEADYADQDELKDVYPLNPTSWTFIDAESAQLAGHATRKVAHEDAVYGIVPTNNNHFEEHKNDYQKDYINSKDYNRSIINPYQHLDRDNKNALFMYSPINTVFGYRSSPISIVAESYNVIKVKLMADCNGVGISLVLKNGSKVISTIERIINTNGTFRTYEFYVSGSTADVNLNIELWFGLTDKAINTSKQTSGYAFIDSVDMEQTEESVIIEKAEEYNSDANMTSRYTNFAVYRLGNFDFSAYDRYSNNVIKDAYDFTATSTGLSKTGIIGMVGSSQSELPPYYSAANSAVKDRFNTTLYIANNEPGYTRVAAANSIGLAADTFYKIEFSLLVDLPKDSHSKAVGGGISLGSYAIKDIRNTYKIIGMSKGKYFYDYSSPAFSTFTFFYATGSEAESVDWALTLGSDTYPNERIAGQMFCNKITVSTMDSYYFEDELETLIGNYDVDEVDDIYGYKLIDRRVASEEVEVETEPNDTASTTVASGTNSPWYLVPTILFAVAILIALIGVVVKKLMANKGNRRIKKTVSYDRKMAFTPIKDESSDTSADNDAFEYKQTTAFESFDDATVEDTTKQARKAARKANAPEDEFVGTEVAQIEIEERPNVQKREEKEINEFDE